MNWIREGIVLVGGPADGEMVVVEGQPNHYFVMVDRDDEMLLRPTGTPCPPELASDIAMYNRADRVTPDGWQVYTYSG